MAAPKKQLAKVIARFKRGDESYRLIAKANHTPGYEDFYIIEQQVEDELGDPSWDRAAGFNNSRIGENLAPLLLIDALKQAQRESRGDVVEKIVAYLRTFGPESAAMVDGILEGRFEGFDVTKLLADVLA